MTKHTRIPRARYTGFGDVELTFPYDARLVALLKRDIPVHARTYDPDDKTWTVTVAYAARAIELLLRHFPDAEVSDSSQTQHGLRGRVHTADPFSILHLRETAPVELIEGAYRILARLNHPDLGGSTELMQELNGAYAALRERVRA